jgi:peptide deformylase
MSDLQLIFYPDPRLRKVSTEVSEITPSLLERVRDMFPVMYEEKGIGLAAPQVGWNVRLFVMNVSGEPEDELAVFNPVVTERVGSKLMEEGCLSLPDIRGKLSRPEQITVRANVALGSELRESKDLSKIQLVPWTYTLKDLPARCIQHELDHLDGILIIDKFSPAKKQSIKARLRELEEKYVPIGR